jgi:ABC-2 type transport system permease protein
MSWILHTLKLNWHNAVAHKGSFFALVILMALNNLIYFGLWVVLFMQISSLRGWGLPEVAYLYGAGAMSYGLIFTLFGGLNTLAQNIQSGLLDVFLARPRPVLLSAMLFRMRADSLGDVISGAIMLLCFVPLTLAQIPLVAALSLSAGLVYASFRLFMHTLAFWGVGNEGAENGFITFIIASTNPLNGFGQITKLFLLTLFPAGYIAFLPVEIIRHFSWLHFAWQMGASLTILAFAVWFFYFSLRRYTSGNQLLSLR